MSTFWDRVDNSDSHLSAQKRVGRYQEKEKQDTAHQRGEPGQNPRAISPQTNDIFFITVCDLPSKGTCHGKGLITKKHSKHRPQKQDLWFRSLCYIKLSLHWNLASIRHSWDSLKHMSVFRRMIPKEKQAIAILQYSGSVKTWQQKSNAKNKNRIRIEIVYLLLTEIHKD